MEIKRMKLTGIEKEKRLNFNQKRGGAARKQVVISPLDLGANPRDPTKQIILLNKAQISDILVNRK
jgi:hypothetical protein